MSKNKISKANLESKRKVYLQLGFAVALSFVLAAFEWTDYEIHEYKQMAFMDGIPMEDEPIPFNRPPKPTPPKPKVNPLVFQIAPEPAPEPGPDPGPEPDPFFLDPDDLFSLGGGDENWHDDEPALPIMVAEIMPFFDDCKDVLDREAQSKCTEAEIIRYVQTNVKYPKICVETGIEGTVYMSFVVDRSGNIKDVTVQRGLHRLIDENATNVVSSIPKMNPAKQQGKSVSVIYNIPIHYKLK